MTEPVEQRQLKACPNPWCHRSDGLPPVLTWAGAEAYVECSSCGMQGPWVSALIHDDDGEFVATRHAEAEAWAAWDQRDLRPDDALRAKVQNWRDNLAITQGDPIMGDALHGSALDFVIEQLDGILARTALEGNAS